MKHTPGPWTVDRSMRGELEPFDCKDRHLLNSEGPLPLREREANARLIAAAPDLLQQLKYAAKTLSYLTPETFDDAEHEANWNRMLEDIDKAITKAEGRK